MRAMLFAALAVVTPLVIAPAAAAQGCSATPFVEAFGAGSPGSNGVPSLDGLGTPEIGQPSSFAFEVNAAPFVPGVLILSRREVAVFSSTYNTTLYNGAAQVLVPFQCDSNGTAVINPGRTKRARQLLCGLDITAQAATFDLAATGGAAWTNGLRFHFGTTRLVMRGLTFGAGLPATIVELDPATGQSTPIGPIQANVGLVIDLAISNDGTEMYLSGALPPSLYTVDAATLAVTNTAPAPLFLDGLEVSPAGFLLAIVHPAMGPKLLEQVSPQNGQTTLIGFLDMREYPSLAFHPQTGRLYALSRVSGGADARLVELDPSDASVLSSVNIQANFLLDAMEILPNGRFVISAGPNLFDLDPNAGALTLIGPTGQPFPNFGLANVPLP